MKRPRARRRSGWGLIEVAVACAVIAGIAAGGAQLSLAHDIAVRSSHAEHLALRAALAELDDRSALVEGTTTFAPAVPDGTFVTLRCERVVRLVAPGLAEVTVVVTAKSGETVTLMRRIALAESAK